MAKMYGKGKTAIESEEQARLRFQVELEFVQCLANPNYLNFLAQRGYFKDQAFMNYLKYLQYWKEPEYANYIVYPNCLYFLDMLQYEHFRREIVNSQCAKFIDDQVILMWQRHTRKRIKLMNAANAESAANPDANIGQQPADGQNATNANNFNHNAEFTQQFNNNTPQQQPQQQQQQQGMQNGNGPGNVNGPNLQQTPSTPNNNNNQHNMMNGLSGNGNYNNSNNNNNMGSLLHRT